MLNGFTLAGNLVYRDFFLVGCAVIIGYVNASMWASAALAIVIVSASFMRSFWFLSAE
ncbi:hypothetical protein [Methylomonas rosea]|uniref:Uncharacterized protein n=1 Tax=Methylomonas rosea TaxID=2952227 RepID=A0ABT1TVK5_9GAMM|nr:hypothetical protein [Methylomonas sp. WSC-7]MCQ8118804.1 hypothetical protein [Methylomonas sp. WSC-7]